jgi:hypothetical protein
VGFRATASAEAYTGERDRSAHEFDEFAFGKSAVLVELSAARKFLLEVLLKLRIVLELANTAPNARVFFRRGMI